MPPNLPRGMAFQIYQAWLQGPHALFRLFEEAFGKQALYGPPDPDIQQREINDLSEQIGRLQAQVERLRAEVGDLQGHNLRLQRRNAELEALAAKDSHNSSRPPSTDPPWAKRTRSLRRPSGKRPGGQAGHYGETLRLSERPNRTVEHRPRECRSCHAPLDSARVLGHRRQQVVEVVPARLRVIEHRLAVLRCRACGKTTRGEFAGAVRSGVQYGAGVKARVLYLQQYQLLPYSRTAEAMRDLFGCPLSSGTVANIVRGCADALLETELRIKRGLRRSALIHADETGLRVEGRLRYVHVTSNSRLTHYTAAAGRGRTAIEEAGVLPRYRGTCVHDGWPAYSFYTQCRHALCGAHLLRELTFFEESHPHQRGQWAEPMAKLLLEIKAAAEQAGEAGHSALTAQAREEYFRRYDAVVRRGLALNPERTTQRRRTDPGATAKKGRGRIPQSEARKLVTRLERCREEVLRFMTDFRVPFENNQAERDLRMVKLQQKIGGSFRSGEGAREFCRLRSVVSTARKQGQGVLDSIEAVLRGQQLTLTS